MVHYPCLELCCLLYERAHKADAYIILGKPGTATAIAGIVVPKAMITTTDVKYQITDESYYRCFNLKYSSTTVTLTISTGGGSILRVFGIN